MKKLYILFGITAALLASSCNDWLDVRPETEQKEGDQFSDYKGFRDALTGCYMSMANTDVYGEKLTMSHIESLAGLWETFKFSVGDRRADYFLSLHDYRKDPARTAMQAVYSGLFNVIVQANLIIKHATENENVFDSEETRAVVLGEAYAIRAYCQLDVLRLFGQLPQRASRQVQLPYSGTTAFNEQPDYCPFDEYVAKLEEDLNRAESLLKDHDPLFKHTFDELNSPAKGILEDDFMYYRQSRLNYWALKGLQARFYLYAGRREKAYQAAKAVLDAVGADGKPVMKLSGASDVNQGRYACPGECLFYLSKYDVKKVAAILIGNAEVQASDNYLYIPKTKLDELYQGQSPESHNRYLNLWNRKLQDAYGDGCAAIRKYWFADDVAEQAVRYQIIPMLRMSEMYLIAIETTGDLSEANTLYTAYMRDRNVQLQKNAFDALNVIPDVVLDEYRREFYGEGQMFYTYKRRFTKHILWNEKEMTEDDYILWLTVDNDFNA